MSDLRARLSRAAEVFEPTGDWLDGALSRARKRARDRRITAIVAGLLVFAVSFGGLGLAFSRRASNPMMARPCDRVLSTASTTPSDSALVSVSALASDDAWAVGPEDDFRAGSTTIVERWNGEQWQRVRSPNGATSADGVNELRDVTSIASDDAWAVGEYADVLPLSNDSPSSVLIMHWDGRAWNLVEGANPSSRQNGLNAVAASGPDDVWAVGISVRTDETGTGQALIEHWDGNLWSVVPNPATAEPSGSSLDDIVVVSKNDAWAVGSHGDGEVLVEHWNGSAWSLVDVPQPSDLGFLDAVDATGPNDVWVSGWTTTGGIENHPTPPIVMHFDGSSWETFDLPTPDNFFVSPLGLAAVAPNDVWLTGWMGRSNLSDRRDEFRPLIARWDGETWHLVDAPTTAGGVVVNAVDNAGDRLLFVGRQGGSNDPVSGSTVGASAYAVTGTCVGS